MNKKEQKQKIRQELLKRRSKIPEEYFMRKSALICMRLKKDPAYQKASVIHCYVSINERREVNTHPLIKEMITTDKKVVVPITHTESGRLTHVRLESFDDLHANKWSVLEPERGEAVNAEELDLVIVPMVGGDQHKNRIGYGKGFYDRFLQQVKCPSVGLLFDQCLVDKIPVEAFDVLLSMLLTEKRVIY